MQNTSDRRHNQLYESIHHLLESWFICELGGVAGFGRQVLDLDAHCVESPTFRKPANGPLDLLLRRLGPRLTQQLQQPELLQP